MLLTTGTSLPSQTATELTRLGITEILVVGGPNAVSDDVIAALNAIAPTTRISGANRYATAVGISTMAFTSGVPPTVCRSRHKLPRCTFWRIRCRFLRVPDVAGSVKLGADGGGR